MNVAETIPARPEQLTTPKLPVTMIAARRQLLRSAFDALAAMALFAIASMTIASAPTSASPTNFGRNVDAPSIVVAANITPTGSLLVQASKAPVAISGASQPMTGQHTAWALLGMAFSLLAAMNLAFFRHLRQSYISPRKRR